MELTVVIGANGAGKTTWTRRHRAALPKPFYNADSIAEGLGGWDDGPSQRRARRMVDDLVERDLQNRASFGFESTYSGRSRPEIVKAAKEQGYTTKAYFLGTEDVEINIDRVAKRVREGGHNIAESEIRRRWKQAWQNLLATWNWLDEVTIIDNSSYEPRTVGTKRGDEVELDPQLPTWAEEARKIGQATGEKTAGEDKERGKDPRVERAKRIHGARSRHPDPAVRADAYRHLAALARTPSAGEELLKQAIAEDPSIGQERTLSEALAKRAEETHKTPSPTWADEAVTTAEDHQARAQARESTEYKPPSPKKTTPGHGRGKEDDKRPKH